MTRFKRIVSMFLVLIMVMSLLPLSVIAEDIQSTHTVSFRLTYNGAPKISTQKVSDGELATEPEVSRTGYILEYWYTKTDNGNKKFDFSQPVTEDLVLYARWKQDIKYWAPIWNRNLMQGIQDEEDSVTYTVTFDANGSDVENLPAAQRVKAGECAVEPAVPTRLVYEFGGWYTDSDCNTAFDFTSKIESDITLYAKWIITIYSKQLEDEHIREGTLVDEGETFECLYIDNELIIVTENVGIGRKYVENLIKPYQGKIVGQIPNAGHYQIEFSFGMTTDELLTIASALMEDNNIANAYINLVNEYSTSGIIDDNNYINTIFNNESHQFQNLYEYYHYDTPVSWDSYDVRNWALSYTNVDKAREILKDNDTVIKVGIIDTMFSNDHEDLHFTSIFSNLDSDGNNIALNPDSIYTEDKELYGHYAHGMHVAGIIGAKNNNVGISGICDNVELYGFGLHSFGQSLADITTKFTVSTFEDETAVAILIEKGCRVINYSVGYKPKGEDGQHSKKQKKAVKKQGEEFYDLLCVYKDAAYDFLIVTAAGNYKVDAQYNNAFTYITTMSGNNQIKNNIIVVSSVAPTLTNGNEYLFSGMNEVELDGKVCFYQYHNFGSCVDILAPGTNILSTVPKTDGKGLAQTGYMLMGGTSMASPIVAGIATLVYQTNENLKAGQVKNYILEGAFDNVDTKGKNVTSKMVNAEAAVLKALGYDPRPQNIIFKFIDTTNSSPIKAQSVSWDCVGYTGYNPNIDYDDLSDMFVVLDGNEHTTIDTVSYEIPYGTFEFVFSASGYEDKTIKYTVDDDTNEIIVYMTPNEVTPPTPELPEEGEILRLKFIDADTKLPIQLSDIFHETAEISLGRSTPSTTDEEAPEITISVFESADPSDTEVVLRNVPPLELEEWQGVIQPRGNYQLYFDYTEVLYELPGRPEYPYTIGSYYLTENNLGEYVVTLELAKHFIKVENVTVTETNAADILGDGTAVYDYGTKTLTLTNAILCENGILPKVGAVESNIRGITLNIPEGTTSYLYSTEAQAIDSKGIHIIGKGTLHIGSDADYCAIGHSRFESRDVDIKDTTIIFEGASGGIHCSSFAVEQANISNTGIYGYDEFVSTNSISIKNSIIDITTIDSNILWSHGGDININNSDITLYCVNDELPYGYLLFAESASIYIDSTSTVNLVAPNVGTDEDHELLCATNGIFLENGLIIRNSAGKTCEVYQAGEGWNYSVRCTDGTYPNQIFISAPSTPIPAIKTITVPDRITITDVDYTWYIYVSGERGQFTLNGTFTLFGGNYYYPTVETTWGDTAEISYIKGREYQFSIDVWDTWDSSFDEGKTLGKIIISTGNKSKEITVVINGTFDVSFSY